MKGVFLDRSVGQLPPARNRISASHPPVGVGRILLHRRKLGHARVMRRQMADGIGRPRVAGQQIGLAAAAAEIDLAPLATAQGSGIKSVPRKR